MGGHIEPGLPSGGPPRTPSPFRGLLCTCVSQILIYFLSTKMFTLRESNSKSGFRLESSAECCGGSESWRGALPLVCAAHPRL